MKIEAKKHADIRGKEQLYLVISEGEKKVIVNIGEKTFNAVNELINPTGTNYTKAILLKEQEKK